MCLCRINGDKFLSRIDTNMSASLVSGRDVLRDVKEFWCSSWISGHVPRVGEFIVVVGRAHAHETKTLHLTCV